MTCMQFNLLVQNLVYYAIFNPLFFPQYCLSWDRRLLTASSGRRWVNQEAATYDVEAPDETWKSRLVSREQLIEFFIHFIANENVGRISTMCMVWADHHPEGPSCKEAKELAALASRAVDFVKTGIPAVLPQRLVRHAYPSYMENPNKDSYDSKTVLGQLYLMAKAAAAVPSARLDAASYGSFTGAPDSDFEVHGWRACEARARAALEQYSFEMALLVDHFDIDGDWPEIQMVSAETTYVFAAIWCLRYGRVRYHR